MRARIFNIMQYVNHPETNEPLLSEETIIETVNRKGIKKYAYILHDKDVYSAADEEFDETHIQGQTKPPHWHIVIQTNNAMELQVLAKRLGIGENFIDVPKGMDKGKFLDCVEYLTHENEKQQKLGKHKYDDSEVKSNFNFRFELKKREEDRLKYGKDLSSRDAMRYDVMYGGKTLRECIDENELQYMDDFEKLQKMRMQFLMKQDPPLTRINYYICARGGVGKGLISRALARSLYPQYEHDEDIFFIIGGNGSTFEGYDGQPVIIWDDKRAVDLLNLLGGRGNVFNVFDTHPQRQRQNVKYSSINLCNEVNIVNSVQSYEEFLDGLAGSFTGKDGTFHESEDKSQSYRRFPIILPLHEQDFDMLLNKGFLENTKDFEEYIQYNNIRGNLQKIRVACGNNERLARELEAQTVRPVIMKHNELMSKVVSDVPDEEEIRQMFSDYGSIVKHPTLNEMNEYLQSIKETKEKAREDGFEDVDYSEVPF